MKWLLMIVLNVWILSAAGTPAQNVPLRFRTEDNSISLTCRTDAQGFCRFEFDSDAPLMRGTLEVASYGTRDVIWSGSNMDLVIRLDAVPPETEAGPYQTEEGSQQASAPSESRLWGLYVILLLLFVAAARRR